MVELGDEKVLYAFDKTLEPALVVPSGTTVRVRTKDCFGNQVQRTSSMRSIGITSIPPRARSS